MNQTTLTERIRADLIRAGAAGFNLRDCARYAGVTFAQLHHWLATQPEFSALFYKGFMDVKMDVREKIIRRARYGNAPEVWKERRAVEGLAGPDDVGESTESYHEWIKRQVDNAETDPGVPSE